MTKELIDFNYQNVHKSWLPLLKQALETVDPHYRMQLLSTNQWLPGSSAIFSAFSIPIDRVNYVLFGESPYPRQQSANGYAFWDAAVTDLWSSQGLSKPVNRATSFRNLLKMLLVAEKLLDRNDTSQERIAALDKSQLVQTNAQFFGSLLKKGFLLLNASLVLQSTAVRADAKAWKPFLKFLMSHLLKSKPDIKLIFFGKIANEIDPLLPSISVEKLYAEHPYNHTFIRNQQVLDFFRPLQLLSNRQ